MGGGLFKRILGAIVGLFRDKSRIPEGFREELESTAARVRKILGEIDAIQAEVSQRFRDMEDRFLDNEKNFRLMVEEIDERIERGNKVWRKIRAAQEYEARAQDESEYDESDGQLPLGHGGGGQAEGVSPLHPNMGRAEPELPHHEQIRRQIANQIAGRG